MATNRKSYNPFPEPGNTVDNRYVIQEELGRGGGGVVFIAKQQNLASQVVLKFMFPSAVNEENELERFQQEANLASRLQHPNTVRIHAVGTYQKSEHHPPLPYIVMEYVSGENLGAYLQRKGKLDLNQAKSLLAQILASLEEAHDNGIVHRDVKPANVMIIETNRGPYVKVLDFGIAKVIKRTFDGNEEPSKRLTREGFFVGTPEYLAPEQSKGEVSMSVDVYAVGCIAYEMLTGKLPYNGSTPQEIVIMHHRAPLPELPSKYRGTFIEAWIYKAMAKSSSSRFLDAGKMLDALNAGQISVITQDGFELRKLPVVEPPDSGTDFEVHNAVDEATNKPLTSEMAAMLPSFWSPAAIATVVGGALVLGSIVVVFFYDSLRSVPSVDTTSTIPINGAHANVGVDSADVSGVDSGVEDDLQDAKDKDVAVLSPDVPSLGAWTDAPSDDESKTLSPAANKKHRTRTDAGKESVFEKVVDTKEPVVEDTPVKILVEQPTPFNPKVFTPHRKKEETSNE